MVTYPGLPAPAISDWLSRDASRARYGPGTTFQMGKIDMLANTGTYIDAPFHRFDDAKDGARPAHTILLGAGIPIVEHLCNLGALPQSGFRFFAVPVKVKGMGSFPVRAFAAIED